MNNKRYLLPCREDRLFERIARGRRTGRRAEHDKSSRCEMKEEKKLDLWESRSKFGMVYFLIGFVCACFSGLICIQIQILFIIFKFCEIS